MQQVYSIDDATRELEEDHAQLHELLDGIGGETDLLRMSRQLSALHDRMTSHFVSEEKPGGLYDTLGFCAPEFRRPLALLVDDHFRLAATLRELRDRTRGPGVDIETLRLDVRRLVQAVAEHEKREMDMVKKAGGRVVA